MALLRVTTLTLCAGMVVGLSSPISLGGLQQEDAASPVIGIWEGTLEAAGLRLVFHVEAGEQGGLVGALDSPDQGASGIPATEVSFADGTLRFVVSNLGMTYEATLSEDRQMLEGTFTQGPARLPLSLSRVEQPTEVERPQNPQAPYPYDEEQVAVHNADAGITLAGTLTMPRGDGPFPAAVLVSGSGPQDRDEALMGHRPFLVLADHLTRAGIAVLRYDDRGVAESEGDFATATSQDFTSDALAAVAFLRARPAIGDVGIVGHSEGGLVGPMAAAASDDVAFVVMLAGPGIPGAEIIDRQAELISRAEGTPQEAIEQNRLIQRRLFEAVAAEPDPEKAEPLLRQILEESIAALPQDVRDQMGEAASPEALQAQVAQVNSNWFRFFLSYDPRPTLERVRVPVLALNGEKDLQVPAEINLSEVAAALERGGNPDATTRMLPGLNHLFQRAETGSPSEYARISETMNPEALEAVSAWILSRFGGGA